MWKIKFWRSAEGGRPMRVWVMKHYARCASAEGGENVVQDRSDPVIPVGVASLRVKMNQLK